MNIHVDLHLSLLACSESFFNLFETLYIVFHFWIYTIFKSLVEWERIHLLKSGDRFSSVVRWTEAKLVEWLIDWCWVSLLLFLQSVHQRVFLKGALVLGLQVSGKKSGDTKVTPQMPTRSDGDSDGSWAQTRLCKCAKLNIAGLGKSRFCRSD